MLCSAKMIKAELRTISLARQRNLSPAERIEKTRQIADCFFRNFDLVEIEFLHCFLPIDKFAEVDTRLILERVWKDFPRIETLAPRVDWQTGEIESLRFSAQTMLRLNRWGISEPAGAETIAPQKIDSVLVPLLCVDRRGFRVGYGKGFYDKFLKNCRADCLRIGLSYFPPVEEISDAQSFDIKLDHCVTPEKVWSFEK